MLTFLPAGLQITKGKQGLLCLSCDVSAPYSSFHNPGGELGVLGSDQGSGVTTITGGGGGASSRRIAISCS